MRYIIAASLAIGLFAVAAMTQGIAHPEPKLRTYSWQTP
jgi:hypothetical protein